GPRALGHLLHLLPLGRQLGFGQLERGLAGLGRAAQERSRPLGAVAGVGLQRRQGGRPRVEAGGPVGLGRSARLGVGGRQRQQRRRNDLEQRLGHVARARGSIVGILGQARLDERDELGRQAVVLGQALGERLG